LISHREARPDVLNPEAHSCNAGSGRSSRERLGAGPVLHPRAPLDLRSTTAARLGLRRDLVLRSYIRRATEGAPPTTNHRRRALRARWCLHTSLQLVNTPTRRWRRSSRQVQSTAVPVACQHSQQLRVGRASALQKGACLPEPERAHKMHSPRRVVSARGRSAD
jgi:hypothetical protein